ncbi:uncharacterized protein LOC108824527 [Raphanus sativus]|uniref:Uncharacterized protein LOC108824527 n=1 Tax=Raphanus sativus TaxID=3726 RepID=A0A9W3CFC6_RAPSA|nr:uncharacterized protein LOC108824527 [Raphanus sativus]
MSGFFWNIRGFNKKTKHSVVREWIRRGSFQFGCLLETRVKEAKASRIADLVFGDWSFLSNYENNRLGRIWIVWSPKVRVTPFFKSGQVITCAILLEGMTEEIFCSFVYAANTVEERRELWQDLKAHQDSPIIKNKPWLIFGDFNEILDENEHTGNEEMSYNGMREFQEVANYGSLMDMSYQGPKLTWSNKRDNDLICKKLDRTLMNEAWIQSFPQAYCVFEAGGCSDHLRCRIVIKEGTVKVRKPFKFVNAAADLPEKPILRNLSKDHIGDIVKNLEEKILSQKAKVHWLGIGDGNNKQFHRAAKAREVRNAIREIHKEDGTIVETQEEIKEEAVRHFSTFLSHKPEDFVGIAEDELKQLLDFECDETDMRLLDNEVSEEEIKKVLFSMAADKSPGPDGFTCVNSTILALIPKKNDATKMGDYRPISCCNVLYKVLSKILANRLKRILPKFISTNQSAFVKDRLIMENVLLASELVKCYHKTTISSRCAVKIDISKAFDSVQWSFVLSILSAIKLPEKFILWVKKCIELASFSVQINGELAGYFNSARGLRQGCSLSPYLFVMCMEVLSKLLDRAAVEKKIGFHPYCQEVKLTHLCFADDLLVFSDGKKSSVEGILQVFKEFASISGLRISLEKSTLFLAGLCEDREAILAQFPFEVGTLPVRYLGVPLLTKRMTSSDYSPLVNRIKKRITSWTARQLSFAGRLQLIGSVIHSITNFWMAVYRLPKQCIKEIDQLCSAFLWSGPAMSTSKAKISWENVCRPKDEGGLGLRSLSETNRVCCLKLIWRITSQSTLWVQWVKRYLIRKGSFWSVSDTSTLGSWIWKKLLKYRALARSFVKVDVRNGAATSFWFDEWSPLGRILDITHMQGCITLGININATVEFVVQQYRSRRYRAEHLITIDREILKLRTQGLTDEEDVVLWKGKGDVFRAACPFTETIWRNLSRKLLGRQYSPNWSQVLALVSANQVSGVTKYLLRYVFQVSVHTIWLERNGRRHGNMQRPSCILIKFIDKQVRNRISSLQGRAGKSFTQAMVTWFSSRE